MGEAGKSESVLLIIGAFSRYEAALAWAAAQASARWGALLMQSEPLPFGETDYYEPTMGRDLRMQLNAFGEVDPAELPRIKLQTNELETVYAAQAGHSEARPLNLDPGYLGAGKFVLATTKDASHRLYLSGGIYGEVTLYFSHGGWREREWTYPNYRREDYRAFLVEARKLLLARRRGAPNGPDKTQSL